MLRPRSALPRLSCVFIAHPFFPGSCGRNPSPQHLSGHPQHPSPAARCLPTNKPGEGQASPAPLHSDIKADPRWAPARRALCCKGSSKNSPGLTAPRRRAGGGSGLAGSWGEESGDTAANPTEESAHPTLPRGFATNRAVLPSSLCQLGLVDALCPRICLPDMLLFSSSSARGQFYRGRRWQAPSAPTARAGVVLPWGLSQDAPAAFVPRPGQPRPR